VEGQLGDGRLGMAAVGVVELDEGIEAVLGVGVALPAPQDLVGRGCLVRLHGVWPPEQLCVIAVGGRVLVLGVGAPLCCGLRTCESMTA